MLKIQQTEYSSQEMPDAAPEQPTVDTPDLTGAAKIIAAMPVQEFKWKTESTPAQIYRPHRIISATTFPDRVEIVRSYPSHMAYGNGETMPDTVEKEIVRVDENGMLVSEIIKGKHQPARMLPEEFIFDEKST